MITKVVVLYTKMRQFFLIRRYNKAVYSEKNQTFETMLKHNLAAMRHIKERLF